MQTQVTQKMPTSLSELDRVHTLIHENKIVEALAKLAHLKDGSLATRNAKAVCLMRLGKAEEAIAILSPVVLKYGTITVDLELPEKIPLNLATAFLMVGNLEGATSVLNQSNENSPRVRALWSAIKKWRRQQSLLLQLGILLGSWPYDRPVPLDFPPGEV